MSEIALSAPLFGTEELDAVAEVLKSGWVAGGGPKGRLLEQAFTERFDLGHGAAVANCTAALHLSLVALGVGAGDEVIVADYTFPATGHAVLYCGARPRFVDILPDTWTIDPELVAGRIGPATKGIVAVDTLGQCADYEELEALATEHGLFLLEDAACAAGATYQDRPAGSFGDAACFSFHARKSITCGEGGMVTSADDSLVDEVRRLSMFGMTSAYARQGDDDLPVSEFTELGYNYKLSDIHAAIVTVQLRQLDAMLARRRAIADRYVEAFAPLEQIHTPVVGEHRDHTWQSFVLTLGGGLDRGRAAMTLRSAGVQANIGTYASHIQPVYGATDPCPVSADLFARHMAIPMHAGLTEAEVDRVIEAVTDLVA